MHPASSNSPSEDSAFCLWAAVHHVQQGDSCSLLRKVRLCSSPRHHTLFTVKEARKGEQLLSWDYPVWCLQGRIIFILQSRSKKLHHHLTVTFSNTAVPKSSMNSDANNILAMTEIFALYSAVGVNFDSILQWHWEQNLFFLHRKYFEHYWIMLWTLSWERSLPIWQKGSKGNRKVLGWSLMKTKSQSTPVFREIKCLTSFNAVLDATGHRWEKGKGNLCVAQSKS